MKTTYGNIQKVPGLYITWVELVSDDGTKKSTVRAAATEEYMEDHFEVQPSGGVTREQLAQWHADVVKKWSSNEEALDLPLHDDLYYENGAAEDRIREQLGNLSKK